MYSVIAYDNFSVMDRGIGEDDMKRASCLVETRYPTADHVVADYNVLDFGADPEGLRDSTAAIQSALDTAAAEGAGTVWMPAGTYVLTDTVTVPPYCSLRGDWRDPDTEGADYGTVIEVRTEPGLWGPCCFLIWGCTCISGLTFYWPLQNMDNPIPYNYAISMPGASLGLTGYMMATIENITLLNAYKGIGLSITDKTGRCRDGRFPHDMVAVRHIKGSPLYRGFVNTNNDDHSSAEDLNFNSSYWASAGERYHAPRAEAIQACHTNCHGVHRSGYHEIFGIPAEGQNYSQYAMADVGDSVIRRHEVLLLADGVRNEHFHRNGAYMLSTFCKVRSGNVHMMNNVVDNCASWGYHCYAPGKDAQVLVQNAQQYNGTLTHGNIRSVNRKMIDWRPEWNNRL